MPQVLTILQCFSEVQKGNGLNGSYTRRVPRSGDNTLSTTPLLLKHNTPCLTDEDPSVSWRKNHHSWHTLQPSPDFNLVRLRLKLGCPCVLRATCLHPNTISPSSSAAITQRVTLEQRNIQPWAMVVVVRRSPYNTVSHFSTEVILEGK